MLRGTTNGVRPTSGHKRLRGGCHYTTHGYNKGPGLKFDFGLLTTFFLFIKFLVGKVCCVPWLSPHYRSTVGSRLSEHVGTGGCSDNRNVRIIELLIKSF